MLKGEGHFMNAEIVSVGSELLLGQIVDTNATWMAQRLADLGINLYYKSTVGDNPQRMEEVLTRALERADLVITGGGLGPTQDDLTREVVAQVTGRELVMDPDLLQQIRQRFQRRGLILTANNEKQAYIPEGAIPVENPNGTAPSFIVEDPRGVIMSLPGVPVELKWLFDNELVPYLGRKFGISETIAYRVLKVADLGESSVDARIGYLIANSGNPTVGVLAHPGQVDVRIAAKSATLEGIQALIEPVEAEVRGLLGDHVFGADGQTMESVVGELLEREALSIAAYEDITGGMVAENLQRASLECFLGGVVGGSTGSTDSLLSQGAPSSQDSYAQNDDHARLTADLARRVKERTGAHIGLAVHGVPGDGKPAENLARGTSYLAIHGAIRGENVLGERTYSYAGRSLPDRRRLTLNALNLVRSALTGKIANPRD